MAALCEQLRDPVRPVAGSSSWRPRWPARSPLELAPSCAAETAASQHANVIRAEPLSRRLVAELAVPAPGPAAKAARRAASALTGLRGCGRAHQRRAGSRAPRCQASWAIDGGLAVGVSVGNRRRRPRPAGRAAAGADQQQTLADRFVDQLVPETRAATLRVQHVGDHRGRARATARRNQVGHGPKSARPVPGCGAGDLEDLGVPPGCARRRAEVRAGYSGSSGPRAAVSRAGQNGKSGWPCCPGRMRRPPRRPPGGRGCRYDEARRGCNWSNGVRRRPT